MVQVGVYDDWQKFSAGGEFCHRGEPTLKICPTVRYSSHATWLLPVLVDDGLS